MATPEQTELVRVAGILDGLADRLRTMAAPMKRICSWCETVMADGTLPASHGICPECIDKLTDGRLRLAHDPRD